jgi:vacuolar-type H+-ATPase catalytic subunit A/Vma1
VNISDAFSPDFITAPKWQDRQTAILNLAAFSKTDGLVIDSATEYTSAILVLVKEHTKGFKETNVNVTKAIMQLFIALSELHASRKEPFPDWAYKDGVSLAVDKIADKKLSASSFVLLTNMCIVRLPQGVVEHAIVCVGKVKSPLGHEAFLRWSNDFFKDFGASSIGTAMKSIVSLLLKVSS